MPTCWTISVWPSYLKTTGSRGLHVVVPLRRGPDFDTVRQFARDVADVVAADDPAHRTVEQRKDNRGDRIYLDVMRNAYAQTAVAPYAVRARRGAPVATPLEWDELARRGLRADRFTIRDVPKRIAENGDPWADLQRHARSLARADSAPGEDPCVSCPTSRVIRRNLASTLPGRRVREVDVGGRTSLWSPRCQPA